MDLTLTGTNRRRCVSCVLNKHDSSLRHSGILELKANRCQISTSDRSRNAHSVGVETTRAASSLGLLVIIGHPDLYV